MEKIDIKIYRRRRRYWRSIKKQRIRELKERGGGTFCSICKGQPWSEVHHILPIQYGGRSNIENLAAVCPDCHYELHYLIEKTPRDNELLAMDYHWRAGKYQQIANALFTMISFARGLI